MSQNFQPEQTSHLNKDEIIQAINDMSPKDKQAVVEKASAGLRPPDRKTSDTLWLIIIYSFAIVLVGTFVSLAIGVLVLGKSAANSELQILLTMFTGVVAFLAGLLTQGPTRTGQPPA
jgi:uncharacterized membrane protein YozB (DUF420 family)